MSLAILKRKTKAKQRLRTRGNFILNMTGRGNVLGMNAKMNTRNCGANTKQCRGRRARCCNESPIEPDCCRFKHGGKPAPQMGYRVYLNRKSNGAYRPAGGPCCKTAAAQENARAVWQQPANISAGTMIEQKKLAVLACNRGYGDITPAVDPSGCPVRKNICGCRATDLVRYTRINHNWCTTTQSILNRSASEQITYTKALVDCVRPMHRDIFITLDRSGAATHLNFNGCCGNQCLISGQRYTFHITILAPTPGMPSNFRIRWCGSLEQVLGSLVGGPATITGVFSATVPDVACSGLLPASLIWYIGDTETDHAVTFDYCQVGMKKPQMLGSCAGR